MDKVQAVATDALRGMLAAITGMTPPEGPPPQFIQAAIDRAAERIRGEVVPVAVDRAVRLIETRLETIALPHGCLPVPRWACERLLIAEPHPSRINAETAVSELLRGVVPTAPADHDAPRQARLLRAEVARLRQQSSAGDEIPDFTPGSGNKARRRAEALGITIVRPGLFRQAAPEGIDSEGGSCD